MITFFEDHKRDNDKPKYPEVIDSIEDLIGRDKYFIPPFKLTEDG